MPRLEMTHEAMRHYYRGRVFESTGETNIAIEEYRKAVEMGADYADIYNSLGRAYAKKGMFKEAADAFKNALQLNPHYLEAQRNLNELETRLSIMEREKQTAEAPELASATARKVLERTTEIAPAFFKYAIAAAGIAAVIGIIIFAGPALLETMSGGGKIETFTIPSENITAISSSNNELWLSDWLKQEIYKMRQGKEGLAVANTYVLSVMPAGIAEARDYLWTCDTWSKKINKHVYDDKLSVISSHSSPGPAPSALCWDGKNLWSADSEAKKIYRHNVKDPSLAVTAVFDSPCERQIGLSYDGANYWSIDGEKQAAFKHAKDMSVIKKYSLSIAGKKMSGVLITKKHVWIAFEGENRIDRYPRRALLN